jgi:hypothetical protein
MLEQPHMYKNAELKINLNDTYGEAHNPIFEVILSYEVGQRNYTIS